MNEPRTRYAAFALLMALGFAVACRQDWPILPLAIVYLVFSMGLLGYQQARAWPVAWVSMVSLSRALSGALPMRNPTMATLGLVAGIGLSLVAASAWASGQKAPATRWDLVGLAAMVMASTWLR